MLQSRALLRSQKPRCLSLAFRPHPHPHPNPRPYATVATTISSEPATAFTSSTAAQENFAPPQVVVDANATFAMRTYTPRTPGVRHLKRAIADYLHKVSIITYNQKTNNYSHLYLFRAVPSSRSHFQRKVTEREEEITVEELQSDIWEEDTRGESAQSISCA